MQSPMRGGQGAKGMELYDAGDNVFAPVIHKSVFVQRRRRVGPQDIGKRVEVAGRGMGVLMSFGPHHQTNNIVCGVKMDEAVGDHDGTVAVSCPLTQIELFILPLKLFILNSTITVHLSSSPLVRQAYR